MENNHRSEVIVATCGDYRVARFLLKYLKRVHKLWEMDLLTTAGGSRVISFYGMKENEREYTLCKIKEQAFWIDFETYLGHNAQICVLADHSACGFWPSFKNDDEEDEAHIESLLRARDVIMNKYKQLKDVILIYIIVHKKTHKTIKIKIINSEGKVETIIIEEDKRLAKVETVKQ